MRGISEEDLVNIDPWQCDNPQELLNEILAQCKELNPWIPIDENTPRDRRLNLYWPGRGWITGEWRQLNKDIGYFIHDGLKYEPVIKPTHYQELPEPPKEV